MSNGLDSGEFKAAAGTLDANSQALSDAIGGIYGDPAGEQFLALWRKHIGFFVEYTKGKATKDAALVRKAQQDLDGYRADFDAFLETPTGSSSSSLTSLIRLRLLTGALATVAVAGCGGAGSATVDVRTFNFGPDPLRTAPATQITFVNHNKVDHTITSGTRTAEVIVR